jgi:GNAT superfamily N-acetyltransferase
VAIEIRDLRADELEFLREMLYAALDWRPDVEFPPREFVLAHEQVVICHENWGREGDVAVVAEDDGRPIGAAWYRFFTLMDAIHERARQAGLKRTALSVDADNPAKRLYERLGYVEYEPDDDFGRMILELVGDE